MWVFFSLAPYNQGWFSSKQTSTPRTNSHFDLLSSGCRPIFAVLLLVLSHLAFYIWEASSVVPVGGRKWVPSSSRTVWQYNLLIDGFFLLSKWSLISHDDSHWPGFSRGLITLTIGLATFFRMPPSPTQTKTWFRPKGWFTEREEIIIVNRILRDDPSKVCISLVACPTLIIQ